MNIRNSKTIDETKIRNLIDDRANALRNKDARGVISHLAEDFVQFSLAPPLIATDARRCASARSTAPGPSCMSMNRCRSTWTAASAPRSI